MELWMWIALAVIALVIVALVVGFARGRDRRRLRKRFGPEYERTVKRRDSKDAAHDELERRLERHESYQLRSLDDDERERYVARWRELQRTFTRQPATGLLEADEVTTHLLADVGYPTDSFAQQAADLSVAHADVVDDYREARAVTHDVRGGRAGTEEIRVALLRYRKVFERVAEASVIDDEEEVS
ncbi:MAG TPA: hypothetical protein VFZ70_09610 [Euzebyales bacterium]